jgi:hypothetical protein
MTLRKKLKKYLQIPESWDKFDYEIPRYSFLELEDVVGEFSIPDKWIDEILDEFIFHERGIDMDHGLSRTTEEIEAAGILPSVYYKLKALKSK